MITLNDLNPFASNNFPPPSKIISLHVYPIKSCRGFEVPRTTLLKSGLALDRQWMFVDAATRKFLTIRDLSQMTLVRTSLSEDGSKLQIRINETNKSVEIPVYPSEVWLKQNTKPVPATVWGTETDGYEYSETVTSIFSDFFERKVALILKGPTPRILEGSGASEHLGRTESTQFADLAPVQIASQASMNELNTRLKTRGHNPITIERFRPNIVIEGTSPWSEDSWSVVRINGTPNPPSYLLSFLSFLSSLFTSSAGVVDIDVACRCARCLVPNVDPDTAEKDKHEPWDTLVSFRRVDEGIKYKPCFGMLCVPRNEGEIAVGMRFEVLKVTDKHFYVTG